MVYNTLVNEYPKKANETWPEYKERLVSYELAPEDLKVNTLVQGYTRAYARIVGRPYTDPDKLEEEFKEREFTRHEDGTATLEFKLEAEIKTEEEALQASNIDTDVWRVKECSIRHWSTPMKVKKLLRDDGVPVEPGVNWQDHKVATTQEEILVQNSGITLKLVPKTPWEAQFRENILRSIKPLKPHKTPFTGLLGTSTLLLELCIFDLHLGKTAFDPIKGEVTWSLDEARDVYIEAVRSFLEGVDLDAVDRIVLPVGNDLLNIDTNQGTTTKGTYIQNGGVWFMLFTYALRMIEEVALELSQYAPVEIVGVPGNHDEMSILSLVCALEKAFSQNEVITVRSRGLRRDHIIYGNNFIGWIHGDKVKPVQVKDAFMADCPEFSRLPFKYAHLGHLHSSHKKDVIVKDTITESYGVEVEHISSLCPTDYWHYKNLYVGNMRRAKAFVYDRERGNTSQVIFNLLPGGKVQAQRSK